MKLYSVYDEKALCYGIPTSFPTDGIALRSFSEVAQDPDTQIHKYPSDFKLYFIGTFDEMTGQLDTCVPVYLANGAQYVFDSKPTKNIE